MQPPQDSLQHPCDLITKRLRRIRHIVDEEISLPTRSAWDLVGA
jgi:hypothetical protein